MASNFQNPNTQGKLSLICSIIGLVLTPVLIFVVFQRYNVDAQAIFYASGSLRVPAVMGLSAIAGLLGLGGFSFGIASIGQLRNDYPKRSWVGFLIGALTMVLAGLSFLAFFLLKEPAD